MKELFTTATPAEWRKTKREANTRIAEIYEAEGFDRVVNINVTSPYGEQIGVLKVTA